jgi:hypothetical protein
MVVKGIKDLNLPLVKYINNRYTDYNPAQPNDWKTFHWNCSPFIEMKKPEGN